MKKILAIAFTIISSGNLKAQEIIKVGEEKTITCTGTFTSQLQNYYSNGTKASISKFFMDNVGDSIIVFEAIIYADRVAQTVIKRSVAKKDIDKGDAGIEIETVKENGATFQLVKIKTTENNNVVKEETYKKDDIEIGESIDRILIYFGADKEKDAKILVEKLKK